MVFPIPGFEIEDFVIPPGLWDIAENMGFIAPLRALYLQLYRGE